MCYKSYPSRRDVARKTNVLHVRIQFYGQGYFITRNKVYKKYILHVIKYILAMALCARNAHIIVLMSPLELVNLVNLPYIIAHVRTTSRTLPID